MLTDLQLQTLATGLRAETDASVIAALSIRDDVTLTTWCNTSSLVDAWNTNMDKSSLFEATDVTLFDNLTAGKRDLWKLLMDNTPVNMSKNKIRKAVLDTWGATNSIAVLQACTRKATNGENYLGGTDATTNTVTAKKLNYTGYISLTEVSQALNRF